MNIDKYKIEVMDEFNLKLTMIIPAGKNVKTGEEPEEGKTSERFIGYYSSLAGALIKLTNMELKDQLDQMVIGDVINAIQSLEDRINEAYGSRRFTKLSIGDKL